MATEQNFKNHVRRDPLFQFIIMPVLLANIVVTCVWYRHHHWQHHLSGPWAVLLSVVLLLLASKVRGYALQNQNRLIRLEERLRLASLLSPGELAEVDSLTTKQLIALRFASNPELPELARRAVREKLEPKQIKAAIKSWRADYERI